MELFEPILHFFAQRWVHNIIWAVILAIGTAVAAKVVSKTLNHLLNRDDNPLPASSIFINIARAVIWMIGGSFILDNCFGINANALVAALGVGGIAISLGFQDTLSNLIGGMQVTFMGIALSAILFALWQGRYCGLGTNLISAALDGDGKVAIIPWDWALKFALTITTLAAGYQGGEVTPLFSIGASLGVVLAGILGMPVELCASLGYAAVFGSATNTLLAPILIGCEVFGFGNLPMFIIVCVVAYLFNMDKSIYALQERA